MPVLTFAQYVFIVAGVLFNAAAIAGSILVANRDLRAGSATLLPACLIGHDR